MQQSLALSDNQLDILNTALEEGVSTQIKQMLNSLSPADAAHLLTSSTPKQRSLLWKLIDAEYEGYILNEMSDDVRQFFIDQMNIDELIGILEGQDIDDIADLLQQLPQTITQQLLSSMSQQDRQRVEAVMLWPEDTAGGLMNTDTTTVRPHTTIDVALRYIRRHKTLPEPFDSLLVVERDDTLIGVLSISRLLTQDDNITVADAMNHEFIAIPVEMQDHQVAQLFEREDLISAPVIDQHHRLLGRITVDDVVDVIREEANHSVMSRAGLDEDEDTFAPTIKTARRRATWLGINLITAFISASVIGLFQDTIDKVVALAVLMPIVASMGGIAGSQSMTLIIRAMALGQIGRSNTLWLVTRELIVGLSNGIIWACVVAIAAMLWFNDPVISLVIALSMVITLPIAVTVGAVLPMILKALRIDPALAGSVVLTTITDVAGFMAFLGLATLFYA
ncbi:MAG: magnesium transporter [Endozoicomonadaceae bacterium]|nr:magnesium transporter [Endozoicomonadaceae bacterium]